jgi:hypothetical protein
MFGALKFFFLLVSCLSAQEINFAEYKSIPSSSFVNIFLEEFDTNKNNWLIKTDSLFHTDIKDNEYCFTSLSNITLATTQKRISIDGGEDFEIEADIKFVQGYNYSGNGLLWGGNGRGSYFGFYFTGNGYYGIFYFDSVSHGEIALLPWQKNSHQILHVEEYNKLTVRKSRNEYYFFINKYLVFQTPYRGLYGNEIGFVVSPQSEIRIALLRVSYIGNPQFVFMDNEFLRNTEEHSGDVKDQTAAEVPQLLNNQRRLALVIGNAHYLQTVPLRNPVNDAKLMSGTLRKLGFEVIQSLDASKAVIEKAVREFSRKMPHYDVSLFYYAGHGIQFNGINYIIPVDADLKQKDDAKFEAVPINFIVEELEKYSDRVNIVILDACRNNPFRSWVRGGERAFVAIPPASGTIISFATSEGATAIDGDAENGLFTEELVKQMNISQPIEGVFKKTRIAVERRSKGFQSPQEWSKLKGDFYFISDKNN